MTDQNGTTQEGGKKEFDMAACMEVMGEMFSQEGCNCDCGEMMSQTRLEGELPEEWLGMMGKMMERCFGESEKVEEVSKESVEEAR